MPKALAGRCRLSRDQVQRALGKLATYGMARREALGWLAVPVDVEQVAAKAGTQGRGAARKAKHTSERALRAGNVIIEKRLRQRWEEEQQRRAAEALAAKAEEGKPQESRFQPLEGTLYCQNCGQGVNVFEAIPPPPVCAFCAENYGWKQDTIWLSPPPSAGECSAGA
jgi:rubrerythrin